MLFVPHEAEIMKPPVKKIEFLQKRKQPETDSVEHT